MAVQDYFNLTPEQRAARVKAASGISASSATPTPSTPSPMNAAAVNAPNSTASFWNGGPINSTPSASSVGAVAGISAAVANAPKTPTPSTTSTGYTPPAYGSNVAGFDANNTNHKALADAGQSWATAKASGDTVGMSAAAALGEKIRSGVQGASYDSVKGVSTLPAMPQEVRTQAMPTPVHNMPMSSDAVTSVRSSGELQEQSGDSLAIERAALKNAIDTQMASLKNNSAYANQLTNDSRVLNDFSRTQSTNPFANMGKKSFDEGLIGRQRSIDDNSRNAELQTQMNSLSTEMANFDKLSPERQRGIYNELLALERNFGLNVGQLTGDYAGNRTLAGQQQDFAQGQQEWENKFNYGNAIGTFANGQQTLQNKQFQEGIRQDDRNFDRAKYESDRNYRLTVQQQSISNGQWQQQFNADIDRVGFQQASELWSQAFQENQAGQDDAYRKSTLEQSMTQADRSAANNATDSILKSGLVTKFKDEDTGTESIIVTNPESLNKYILSLNLSDNATDSLLYQYGLDSYVKK